MNYQDIRPHGLRMLQASVGGQLYPSQPHNLDWQDSKAGAVDLYSLLVG